MALALLLAAALVLWQGGILRLAAPPWIPSLGSAGAGVVLIARGIGDFRLVGLFKRVRGTRFAFWDSRLYTPLALVLGAAALWVSFA